MRLNEPVDYEGAIERARTPGDRRLGRRERLCHALCQSSKPMFRSSEDLVSAAIRFPSLHEALQFAYLYRELALTETNS